MPLRRHVALLSLILACTPTVTSAQRMLGADPNRDPRLGVYVRDSAVAAEKLALAERMERLKEWDKSADVYQEIVEKYSDRVVPSHPAARPPAEGEGPASPQRYKSVTLAVQERLGKWPEDGLAMYRARYETAAETLRESAGVDDAAALSRVVQLYFPTDAAKAAAMRLIELYLETGEFAAAAWTGERMLAFHPGLGDDRAKLLFRTALAEHLAGDAATARGKLEELKSAHADAKGTFRGQEVTLSAELEKVLASPAAVANGASIDSWPLLGGDATRGRVPAAAARPGAKLVEIPIVRPRLRPPGPVAAAVNRQQLEALEKSRRDAGATIGVMPVVDRGEIFYQDNFRIYAKGLESGFTLPGWTTTYGEDTAPTAGRQRYANANAAFLSGGQLTVTVTDATVLAVLGQPGRGFLMNEMGMPIAPGGDTQLVCLDRATGARRWSISPRHFPDSMANLRELQMGGSPLVVGDNVYVAARGGKPMQFEDSYVLCFNLADGKARWACYLASGNAQNFPQAAGGDGDVSHLAYSGGRVYAVTNIGAVAAIDAYAGTIAWLSLYPRPQQVNNGNFRGLQFDGGGVGAGSGRRPWTQNPAVVKDGRVFCLPSDSQHLIVYDAATGDELKRIAMSDFDQADTVVGVHGERLVLTSNNEGFCLNWQKYDPASPLDSLLWKSEFAGPDEEEKNRDTVRGRAFMTTDSVFVPTRWNLRRLSLATGRAEQTYPPSGSWDNGEGPGNVLVIGDQIIVAGTDAISVYADLALTRAKLDRALESAPNDPLPRLMYAETLFAAGQIDAAIEKLDAAIQLLGGGSSMRPGPERDRAFARSLAFAERVASPREGAADLAKASALYDRAAAAASSPPQQVAYRLSRARFARQQRDFHQEVRLYQEILSNPAWRAVIVPADDASGTVPAATLAENAIGERVKDAPASYRPFEQAAAEQLAIARQAKDPAQMLAVAQVYPNARVAPEAMLAAAEAFENAGKFRYATQVLSEVYRKYHEQTDRARIIEAQARNYLKLPGHVGIAIGRLMEGNKLQSGVQLKGALELPDGQKIENVSFGAAAEILQRFSARLAAAALPDFNIPPWKQGKRRKAFLPETPDSIIADVDLLLVPPRVLRDAASRHDRVVTWSRTSGVSVFAVGSNQPIGSNAAINREPTGMAWTAGKDLLVWTADQIVLLKGDGLATGWNVGVRGLPQVEVVDATGELSRVDDVQPPQRGVAVGPGLVFVDNQLVNVGMGPRPRNAAAAAAAARAREQQQQAERVQHVRPLGDRVIVATSSGRIAALDLASGELAWQTRAGEAALEQLVANDDFVAGRFIDEGGPQLVALETFGGQIVMRTTFTPETAPLNIELAPDGTLLYTRPDRICGKNLYEPASKLKFGDQPLADGQRIFDGSGGADQIVVAEGRIYAVADNGQFIRVLSLEQGKEVGNRLSTGSTDFNNVRMQVVGPRLYVFNSRTVTSYHVVRDDESWTGLIDSFQAPSIRDAFIGRQHIVLLDQPTPPGVEPAGDAAPRFRLLAYGRYPTAEGRDDESGKFDQSVDITHPVGIHVRQWQAVEGGFYYHSVDRKVHFLKGAGTDEGS